MPKFRSDQWAASVPSAGTRRSTFASCLRAFALRAWSTPTERNAMKTQYTVTLAMVAGFGLGAIAVQGLHAQAKPPVYSVTEITVTDLDAYTKEYAPLAQASIKKSGGKLLAAGQKVTSLEGAPPAPRIAIHQWDSL